MPKSQNENAPKTAKRCECGATIFQGPVTRGPIQDGAFKARETLYQCVNCHRVVTIEMLDEYELPAG